MAWLRGYQKLVSTYLRVSSASWPPPPWLHPWPHPLGLHPLGLTPISTTARHTTYLPLLNQRSQLVSCHGHTMEVCEYILAVNVLWYQPELSKGNLIILQIGQRHLKHTALKTVTCQFWGKTNRNDHTPFGAHYHILAALELKLNSDLLHFLLCMMSPMFT